MQLRLGFAQQRKRGQLIQQLSVARSATEEAQMKTLLTQEAAFNRRVAIVALTGATAQPLT